MEGQGKTCNLLYDSGSNINLIRHAYAQELGLPGSPVSQVLQVTGKEPEQQDTFLYNIPLRRTRGEIEYVAAYGIQNITAYLSPVSLVPIITFFSAVRLKDIQRPIGKVDLLLGVHEARLFPTSLESHDNLLLQRSIFGSGLLLSGYRHSRPMSCMLGVTIIPQSTTAPTLLSPSQYLLEGEGCRVTASMIIRCARQAARPSLSRGRGKGAGRGWGGDHVHREHSQASHGHPLSKKLFFPRV